MLIHQTLRLRHSFQKDWPKNDNRAISLSQKDPNDECNGGLTVPWHPKRGRTEWKHWHKASKKKNYVFQKTITRYDKTKSRQFRSTKHAGLNASLQHAAASIIDISSPGLQILDKGEIRMIAHSLENRFKLKSITSSLQHLSESSIACWHYMSGMFWLCLIPTQTHAMMVWNGWTWIYLLHGELSNLSKD